MVKNGQKVAIITKKLSKPVQKTVKNGQQNESIRPKTVDLVKNSLKWSKTLDTVKDG